MSKSTRATVRTEHGVVAEITLHPDSTYEVNSVVRKERDLRASSLRDVGDLATRIGGKDEFGRDYGRIDLT
jgi:hypothetical protein